MRRPSGLAHGRAGLTRLAPDKSAPQIEGAMGSLKEAIVEAKDARGNTLRVSSPGAFGFTPWVDWRNGSNGVLPVTAPCSTP